MARGGLAAGGRAKERIAPLLPCGLEDAMPPHVPSLPRCWPLAQFYAPWCGYCKDLKPSFTDAAKGAKGKAHFGGVDCTEHHSVCQKYEVPGYPTLKKFGADKEKPEEFEVRAFKDWGGVGVGVWVGR